MNKKAQMDTFKILIISLVIFVLLFYLTNTVMKFFVTGGAEDACLLSVMATSKTRGTLTDALSLECHTNFYGDIKPDGLRENDKKEYMMREVAELMYSCWKQFGKGDFDAFPGKVTAKEAHCFICSKFNLNSKTGLTIEKKEFIQFLHDKDKSGSKIGYYNFLQDGFLWEEVQIEGQNPSRKEDPIIFVKKMTFNKLKETGFWGGFFARSQAFFTLNFDLLMDYLFTKTEPEELTELEYNQGPYAVVYFQISDEYWQQMWATKKALDKTSDVTEKIFDTTIYEERVPPSRILITRYETVKDLDCGMLQG